MGRYITETHKRHPSLHRKTSYDVLIVKSGLRKQPVRVTKRPKTIEMQKKKPYGGKLVIRPFHPWRRIEILFRLVGGLPEIHVVKVPNLVKVGQAVSEMVGSRNSTSPVALANSLKYKTAGDCIRSWWLNVADSPWRGRPGSGWSACQCDDW